MREYETTFIVQPEISDEGVLELCERLDGTLGKGDSERLLYDDLGRRRMAYEIRNFQKGRYLTLHFLDAGTVVPELERVLRLDDSVLRFLTILVEEEVEDIEARKTEAAEVERVRAQKAAERSAREAEDAARAAAEATRAAEEAARAAEEAARHEAERAEEDPAEAAIEGEEGDEDRSGEEVEAETASEDDEIADPGADSDDESEKEV